MVENQIIPFLQRLPKQLNKRQRIILEAIDISAESIELSMHRIQQLSLDVVGRDGDPNFSATERSMLFLDAWGIVDRAHNIRTLLKRGQPSIAVGEGITFDTEASKGSLMRNAMDHLADNMGNIVEKDRSPPIYGIITFVWAEQPNCRAMVSVSGSGFHHAFGWAVTEEIAKPMMSAECEDFILRAFNLTLDLSLLTNLTKALRAALNAAVEEQCRKVSLERATPDGLSVEELMEPIVGGTTLIVRWTREKA